MNEIYFFYKNVKIILASTFEIDNIRIALSSLINVESTGQNNFHIFIKKINLIHKN
jgi:hypothetical protein